MRSFKNIFLIVSAVAIFSSCNCHCEACLWLDKAYANVGDTVTLHNCSTDNLKDHGTWIFEIIGGAIMQGYCVAHICISLIQPQTRLAMAVTAAKNRHSRNYQEDILE